MALSRKEALKAAKSKVNAVAKEINAAWKRNRNNPTYPYTFEELMEGYRPGKDGNIELAFNEDGNMHYFSIKEFSADVSKSLLLLYNKFVEDLQVPDVKISYLRTAEEARENLNYVVSKALDKRNYESTRDVYAKYTGKSAESFDNMTVKEKITASSLFKMAENYHLFDRASQYYDTDTIKAIYEVAQENKRNTKSMDELRVDLAERLVALDIIDNDMANKMILGERIERPMSSAEKMLVQDAIELIKNRKRNN